MAINRDKVLKAAAKYLKKEQWDNAVVEFRKILEENPNDTYILNQIGDCYLKKGDTDKAVKEFEKAAEIFRRDKQNYKAIAMYRKILRNNPEMFDVHSKLAQLFAEQGLIREAIDQYKCVADSYSDKGQASEALDTYQHIVDLDPGNPQMRLRLAELYQKEGFSEKAIREYSRVAEHLFKMGDQEEAIDIWKKAIDADPNNISARIGLINAYEEMGKVDEALKALKYALDLYEDNTELLMVAGEIYTRQENLEQAQKAYERALRFNPNDLNAMEALAVNLALQGKLAHGTKVIDRVIKHRYKRREYGYALKALKEFSKAAPEHLETHQKLAVVYQKLGQDKGEYEEYEYIADYYYKKGKWEEAFNVYESLHKHEPANPKFKERLEEIGKKIGRKVSESLEVAPPIFEEKPSFEEDEDIEISEEIFSDDFEDEPITTEQLKDESFIKEAEPSKSGSGTMELKEEDILEEVDVYMRYGLRRKAVDLIRDSLRSNPNQPKLRRRLKELTEDLRKVKAAKQPAPPKVKKAAPPVKKKAAPKPEAVDSLKAELEELFKDIKAGVSQQLGKEDYESHYNMGIGYKEMGMLDEAIEEFMISSQSQAFFVDSYSMIGLCYTSKGMYPQAVQTYQKALKHPNIELEAKLGIHYQMSEIFEKSGRLGEALKIYAKIYKQNPNFRDIKAKIRSLRKQLGR